MLDIGAVADLRSYLTTQESVRQSNGLSYFVLIWGVKLEFTRYPCGRIAQSLIFENILVRPALVVVYPQSNIL